jgi:UDP-glucose 4-epimerase
MLKQKQLSNFEYYNLGSGTGNTVLEVIQSFERVSGVKLNYKIVARRSGEVEKIYADTQLAESELGWKALYSLDDMMRSAWKWQQYLAQHPEFMEQ